ncbi:MAG: hypothetical protein JW837_16395 [Sedimentisphaerales bacterium]|nr:hypothetical protein [Sedimentisphaerales bacterium]
MTRTVLPQTSVDFKKAFRIYSELRRTPPAAKRDLKNYVKVFLGIDVPDRRICPEHSSPMDYLWHSFSADFSAVHNPESERPPNADAVIWANRAGGKTELAAVATLLDCIFKPGCQIRILGGSGEQATRMYEYLTGFLNSGPEYLLAGPVLKSKCRFTNGSSVEVLTQSPTSVRGQHIQKLRCDELELFDEDVFAAAKFTTQSTENITAAMELISTMHRPYGLMQNVVSSAPHLGTPVFKWCMWEVIEKCTDRNCSRCPLSDDCRGRAKASDGYLRIDDCIAQMRRASRAGWEAEMLCKRPSRENVVFAQFDPDTHVRSVDYDPELPLYRALDFGFVNPFVCLWIQVDTDGIVRVIDEYVRSRATIDIHADEIKKRTAIAEERVAATFCDPAGKSVNDVTGTSTVRELRTLGISVRSRRSGILEGIELIRRAVRSGSGRSTLIISPGCQRLIEAMQSYHYPHSDAAGELPLKDGLYDHPIDALRYFFVNYSHPSKTTTRRY